MPRMMHSMEPAVLAEERKPQALASPESASTEHGSDAGWSKLSEATGDTAPPSDGVSECGSPCSEKVDPEKAALRAKLHRYAYSPSDVGLCEKFADMVCIEPNSVNARVMLVRMVRMLQLCDYTLDDVVAILSLASVHLDAIFAACPGRMEDMERASIAVLQCYNAHCYLQDEACPMKYWRKNIYGEHYCSIRVLNAAAMKVFKILKFKLYVPEEERLQREQLLRAAYV